MSNRTLTSHPFSAKYVTATVLIMTALVALLYVVMLQFVFPHEGNIISVYVPARSGGSNFNVTPDEFMLWGGIALAVAAAMAAIVFILTRLKNNFFALVFAMTLTTLSGIYLATYVGNIFDELWGGWWSVPGAVSMLVIMIGLEIPLTNMFIQVTRERAKN